MHASLQWGPIPSGQVGFSDMWESVEDNPGQLTIGRPLDRCQGLFGTVSPSLQQHLGMA